jgi:hypothetical protein
MWKEAALLEAQFRYLDTEMRKTAKKKLEMLVVI